MNRRGFLFGAGTAGLILAAPSIVRASSIMAVKPVPGGLAQIGETGIIRLSTNPHISTWVITAISGWSEEVSFDGMTLKLGDSFTCTLPASDAPSPLV